jgi:cell division protease FtsH
MDFVHYNGFGEMVARDSDGFWSTGLPAPPLYFPPDPVPPPVEGLSWWDHVEPIIFNWAPILFMALLVFFIWRMQKLMPKTKPQEIKPNSSGAVKWEQIAGADEAKAELQEVIDFLRDPKRFSELGAKVPKGILLHGPPGTGKTLLAKAVANESGAQFFAQSAASFVEMFAGLGAARIRRLFAEARKAAPAIVFIDEIDAVGAARGSDNNSEREQTLNQLLVELDGFAASGKVVVIAASNLLEKLDSALLRPGRFDRQIFVSPPDVKGRRAILGVHTRDKPLHEDVDFDKISRRTAGLTGAELANICNEAAISAARSGRRKLQQGDFDAALERVVAGMETPRTLNPHEREVVAFHEAGHALCAELLDGATPTHRISIIPRGKALGYTLHFPDEDRYLSTQEELMDQLTVSLGGRAAEQLVFGSITNGASDDLRKVAELTRRMIHEWAMGTSVSALQLNAEGGAVSDRTRELRDAEQQHLADEAMRRAVGLIIEYRAELDALANALLRHEVLEREEIEAIMAGVAPIVRNSGELLIAATEPSDIKHLS